MAPLRAAAVCILHYIFRIERKLSYQYLAIVEWAVNRIRIERSSERVEEEDREQSSKCQAHVTYVAADCLKLFFAIFPAHLDRVLRRVPPPRAEIPTVLPFNSKLIRSVLPVKQPVMPVYRT